MTAIIDYGVGNLYSLCSSFACIGEDAIITNDIDKIRSADRLILPGVGAFEDAARKLFDSGLVDVIREEVGNGKPLLGICLGMQLLFEKSFEFGEHIGLGFLKGEIRPISDVIPKNLKIPHIGWNGLHFPKDKPVHPLFAQLKEEDCVYFVHSYYATRCDESVIATTEYGAEITAAAAMGNCCGVQFHPEKSGEIGLKILKAFCNM